MAWTQLEKAMQIVALTFFLVPISMAGDGVYKWVDKNGKVSFGDRPDGQTAERVKVPRTPPPSREVQLQQLRTKRALESYATERAERSEKRAERAAERAEREQKCIAAREEQYRLEHAGYLFYRDEGGNKRIIDGAEYDAAISDGRKAVAEHCD